MRNPEDGYTGGVVLVAALVPLLKGALLKEGSADALAASSTADDSAGEEGFELGASSTDEAFAGEGFTVCLALANVSRCNGNRNLTTVTVTGALVTVTVTCEGHESSETTTRLCPPLDASPPLGDPPSGDPLPPLGASPDGYGSRTTTRVEVMVETMVVVGSSETPVGPTTAPFSLALVGASLA